MMVSGCPRHSVINHQCVTGTVLQELRSGREGGPRQAPDKDGQNREGTALIPFHTKLVRSALLMLWAGEFFVMWAQSGHCGVFSSTLDSTHQIPVVPPPAPSYDNQRCPQTFACGPLENHGSTPTAMASPFNYLYDRNN